MENKQNQIKKTPTISKAEVKTEQKTAAKSTQNVKKDEKQWDEFAEMSEMNNFNSEEDKAIAGQLDGEDLVKTIKKEFSQDWGKDISIVK